MSAKDNGLWDFKTYDEKTWFRFLIVLLVLAGVLYVGFHLALRDKRYNYEYTKLSQDQMQFINNIYTNAPGAPASNLPTPAPNPAANAPLQATHSAAASILAAPQTSGKPVINTQKAAAQVDIKTANPMPAHAAKNDTSKSAILVSRVMGYLDNIFDFKLDKTQADSIRKFLAKLPPHEAPAFLNGTRFKVRSYFWLIGPCVYGEILFWAVLGVLSSLLFNLGVVGSNATTDLGNPRTQFDSSEILGQIAKILYAPICTLVVVLGYNYFKDQNIVDISSSKGVIVFAFIGGFYSSRVISLMDRLKDVLLPNSGTTSLPIPNTVTPGAAIGMITVQLALNSALSPAIVTAAGGTNLNNASVQLKAVSNTTAYTGSRNAGDPNGVFTVSSVQPGNYIISADLQLTLPDNTAVHLSAQLTGQVMSGTAPITLTLNQV